MARWLVTGLSLCRSRLSARSVHVGFVVDSDAGTGFSPSSSVFPVKIPLGFDIHAMWGMNRPILSTVKKRSHPMDFNMNYKVSSTV